MSQITLLTVGSCECPDERSYTDNIQNTDSDVINMELKMLCLRSAYFCFRLETNRDENKKQPKLSVFSIEFGIYLFAQEYNNTNKE